MVPSRRILITAGPTHEPIDPVRYLANRSSGRMGLALAQAAVEAGHGVTLLLGPIAPGAAPESGSVRVERYVSTADLEHLLVEFLPQCDVLIMAAAVADYRPAVVSATKLPRQSDQMTITLEPTPDLVAQCVRRKREDQIIIAFALEEPDQLDERAQRKMQRKGVDAIVANPVATMDAPDITPTVMTRDGQIVRPGSMPKGSFAAWLIDWLDHFMSQSNR